MEQVTAVGDWLVAGFREMSCPQLRTIHVGTATLKRRYEKVPAALEVVPDAGTGDRDVFVEEGPLDFLAGVELAADAEAVARSRSDPFPSGKHVETAAEVELLPEMEVHSREGGTTGTGGIG